MQRFARLSALSGQIRVLGSASFKFGSLIVRQQSSLGSTELLQKSPDVTHPRSNTYETDRIVNQYMAFHYAEEKNYFRYDFGPKDHLGFPKRCAKLCVEHMTVCTCLV